MLKALLNAPSNGGCFLPVLLFIDGNQVAFKSKTSIVPGETLQGRVVFEGFSGEVVDKAHVLFYAMVKGASPGHGFYNPQSAEIISSPTTLSEMMSCDFSFLIPNGPASSPGATVQVSWDIDVLVFLKDQKKPLFKSFKLSMSKLGPSPPAYTPGKEFPLCALPNPSLEERSSKIKQRVIRNGIIQLLIIPMYFFVDHTTGMVLWPIMFNAFSTPYFIWLLIKRMPMLKLARFIESVSVDITDSCARRGQTLSVPLKIKSRRAINITALTGRLRGQAFESAYDEFNSSQREVLSEETFTANETPISFLAGEEKTIELQVTIPPDACFSIWTQYLAITWALELALKTDRAGDWSCKLLFYVLPDDVLCHLANPPARPTPIAPDAIIREQAKIAQP